MTINFSVRSALLAAMLLVPALLQAATVSTISREQYRQDSPDEIFWEVAVSCSGVREKRIIEQRADTEQWCAKEAKELCDSSKMGAAKRVCGPAFRKSVSEAAANRAASQRASAANSNRAPAAANTQAASTPQAAAQAPAPTTTVAAAPVVPESDEVRLLSGEIEIEEQRIAIEQQKLDLRLRELELKKRELGIIKATEN